MTDGRDHDDAGPGLDNSPDAEPGLLIADLTVDGEVFAIRRSRAGGGTDYDWISGPNEGYGFGTSASPDRPQEQHRESIRGFLGMIDPATGYIADD